MNVYRGTYRRQVGGGLFSTITRGARPFFLSLWEKLRPAAKSVSKRAANAALNVGADLALNALSGKMNKQSAKEILNKEADKLKGEASELVNRYKRKLSGNPQTGGSSRKRRKTMPRKRNTNSKRRGRKVTKSKKRINKRVKPVKRNIKKRVPKKRINKKLKRVFKDIFSK